MFPHFPKERAARIFSAARVGNVKYIFQFGGITCWVKQGNARRATANKSVHLVVPQLIIGTSRCIGSLCVNHKLFMEWVFVQVSHGGKKTCPVGKTAC